MGNPDLRLIELDYIDSTNNYAMQLIDDDKAQEGLTIVAQSQGKGKGQRGRVWLDEPGECLLMSIIATPKQAVWEQFTFSASVAVAIANVLQKFLPGADVRIKWPNDIIINDKKAAGILIENVLRGSRWTHSVIGVGMNVKQTHFPDILPHATSLHIVSGKDIDMAQLRDRIREHILSVVLYPVSSARIMDAYNDFLYKRGETQLFSNYDGTWYGELIQARADGMLEVELEDGSVVFYQHGQVKWEWTGSASAEKQSG